MVLPRLASALKVESIATDLRAFFTRWTIGEKNRKLFLSPKVFFTSSTQGRSRKNNGDDDKNTTPWPSSEHAAFAFTALAKPGKDKITLDEFLNVVQTMNLGFQLSVVELKRVFDHLDLNGDGEISLEEFQAGRKTSPFTIAMVEALTNNSSLKEQQEGGSGGSCVLWNHIFPPDNFDPTVSTAEFYQLPLSEGFVGENRAIRQLLDYKYHTNYTHERQHFQDFVIRQNVLLSDGGNSSSNTTDGRPLLVYTCGSMGVGKGYVLGWMSANGIVSLERISKIDPDTFKLRLPEWPVYVQNSLELAGTLTHKESGYIAEIASHLAMNNRMNVWVDGSLRNYRWYEKHLDYIRQRWPDYRIAILAIDASENVIQSRLQERAQKTGRHVPEDRYRESSRGIDEGLRRLIPKIDLLAHIINDEESSESSELVGPKLSSVSIIDNSGDWNLIKRLSSPE